ncbi:MAG TPA: PAS domain S-box protein [Methanomicrobiales archaeon]|nr:PAS domain S-box protein [Methanomicrobiales archaeon]
MKKRGLMVTILLLDAGPGFSDRSRVIASGIGDISVLFTATAAEALSRLGEGDVDLVLGYSGPGDAEAVRLLEAIRSSGKGLPFIFIADRGDTEFPTQAYTHGADLVLDRLPDSPEAWAGLNRTIRALAGRWRREENLRLENGIMAAVLNATPMAVCVIRDHAIVWANRTLLSMLGYGEGELIGRDPIGFMGGEKEHRRIDDGLFGTRDEFGWGSIETQVRRRDGSLLGVHLQSRPVDPSDPSQGHIVMGQDMTEYHRIRDLLRKSELRYQDLIDNTHSIILRVDPGGIIRFINRFGETFFGYSSDEIVGRHLLGTILPERSRTGRDLAAMVTEVMKKPEDFEVNVNENMKKSGERVWIAWSNKAIRDEKGRLLEMLSIGNDITDRKLDVKEVSITIAPWKKALIEETDIGEPVFEAAYEIAAEISREGREGKPVGTTFILGDARNVLAHSRQLILNPFEGHPREARMITNPNLRETIKELAQLDGAFVVRGDGAVCAGGRYITIDTSGTEIEKGLGTRHASVAGITQETRAVGIVVSQSGGRISLFKDGRVVRVISSAD